MTTTEVPDWLDFEHVVARFIEAIASGAKVTHNASTPDAHTGTDRQRDVWVEWSVAGHFPVKALISCKYWNTALDQSDIDHFNGEFISSRAQVGIIYARNGFNDRAIEKAKALGLHCCKLYRDEPAELPALIIEHIYHLRPALHVNADSLKGDPCFRYWKDLFALPFGDATLFDLLVSEFDEFQHALRDAEWQRLSECREITVTIDRSDLPEIDVIIEYFYHVYRSRLEYTILNGSYNITHGAFLGRQTFPDIHMQSEHPGDGWELLDSFPENVPSTIIAIFSEGGCANELTEIGEAAIPFADASRKSR